MLKLCKGYPSVVNLSTMCRTAVATAGLALLLTGSFGARPAQAFTFDLSPSEWAWWPDYCKARYLDLGFRATGASGAMMTPGEIAFWRSHVGLEVFTYVHHHCAGLVWLQRARLSSTPTERDFALRSAEYESDFTLVRIPQGSTMHASILVHLGQIRRAAADADGALAYFDRAIESRPDFPGGYQGRAMIERDRRNLDAAIKVLQRGSDATEGKSAELEYHLGLALLDAGRPDDAVVHARRAYEIGFALPALRDRLRQAGRSLD